MSATMPGTLGDDAHLLIVDDDFLLRSMAAKTLRHAGFEVRECSSGEEALAHFAHEPASLVLLDVMMPGLDGYEVCRRLRRLPAGARVPVLMLTGLNDTESVEQAYACGATDFITKPINWTLLSHRVRYALRASAAAEAMRHNQESLARAQRLASMGNWTRRADGRMDCLAELLNLYGAAADLAPQDAEQWLLSRVVAADAARARSARERLLEDGTPYQIEFGIERADGQVRTVFEQAAPSAGDAGRAPAVEGITQDITDRVQARERILQLAHYDEPTGLPNRQFFAELAQPAIERARRAGTQCAVMHVDLDRFKSVNDAFGHAGGDAVLKTMAGRLRSWIRGSDLASAARAAGETSVLARVGGNAFTLLIVDLDGNQPAALVAQRLMQAIAQPIEVEATSLVLTASIGIAVLAADAVDLPGLARCAEQAVYAAKAAGGAQYRFYDEQMNVQAANRLRRETELRHAIGAGELLLHFQPKFDTASGTIVGAEALVRWLHPQRGMVPPGDFIPLAEESGLILPLTEWVLGAACGSLRDWADAGLPSVPLSVNLPAASLAGPGLVAQLDALMQRFRLTPPCLILEVTESMLMRNLGTATAALAALRDRGYGLSLDDFGTGYSSLSYLKHLPIHELKIDRSFVMDATRNDRDAALVAAIIALGRELGLKVVAEGVELQEQSTFLLERGCSVQQGYLHSRPLPRAEYERLLRAGAAPAAPALVQARLAAV